MGPCRYLIVPAIAAVIAAAETPAARVEQFNRALLQFAGETPKGVLAAPAAGSLREVISERAAAFSSLIETDPKRALELALPESTLATLRAMAPDAVSMLERYGAWSGQAEVAYEDEPGFRSGRRVVSVHADAPLNVYFAYGEPRDLASGSAISVAGVRLGKRVAVARAAVFGVLDAGLTCNTMGEQRVAVILVTFPGVTPPDVTAAQLQDYFFNPSDLSVDGFWRDTSYGKTFATGQVFGPYQLDRAYTCDETYDLRAEAIRLADASADFTQFNRVFIFFPLPQQGCNWNGRGTVGCVTLQSPGDGLFTASSTWITLFPTLNREMGVFLGVHEGGHNLGLGHSHSRDFGALALGSPGEAGSFSEYGDVYSAMGNTLAHYPAQDKLRLGWIGADEIATIDDVGMRQIPPVEQQQPGTRALRVRRAPGSDDWLWFEYHQPAAYSSTWSSLLRQRGFGGTVVRFEDAIMRSGGMHALDTALLDFTPNSLDAYADFYDAPLAAGQVWMDPFTARIIRVGAATASGITIDASSEAACVTLASAGRDHGPGEEAGTIEISGSAECKWTAVAPQAWITLAQPASGAGSASLGYTVAANTGAAARTGIVSIGHRTFTVTQAAQQYPPSGLYVLPASGTGPVARLGFDYFDANGPDDLKTVSFNVTAAPGLAHGCAVEYDAVFRSVRLAGDSGNWSAPELLQNAARLANSQCSVQSVSAGRGRGPEGETLYLSVTLQLHAAAREQRDIFMAAVDKSGQSIGYEKRGVWYAEPNAAPSEAAITPNAGTGMRRVFSVSVKDPNGAGDVNIVEILFTHDNGARCGFVTVLPGAARVALQGASGYGFASFGATTPLDTAECAIDPSSVTTYSSGEQLAIRLPVTFKDAFAGHLVVTVSAGDLSNARLQDQRVGEWIVGPQLTPDPGINIDGVVNAASFRGGRVAPGEIVTIFGTNLGPGQLALSWYENGLLQPSVAGTEVFFDNVRAPLVHTSAFQVSAIVPYAAGWTTRLRLEYQGLQSNEVVLPVGSAAPGIFAYYGGKDQAVAVNQDGVLNSAAHPAERGALITLFVTGEGPTRIYWPDGMLPTGPPYPAPVSTPMVTFGGRPGVVDFAGLVYAGVLQINVRVPADAPAGPAVPVVVTVANVPSPDGVTVALK